MGLWRPQREALEILRPIAAAIGFGQPGHPSELEERIRATAPLFNKIDHDFPSISFSLATGTGKTRLMGAMISFLHMAHDVRNFLIVAPGLPIYRKLQTDFTPGTSKYVFNGVPKFQHIPPAVRHGENYRQRVPLSAGAGIHILNIDKLNGGPSERRGAKLHAFQESLGSSYYDHLRSLPDLVILMDEAHRYRARSAMDTLNGLMPKLGIELTATPYFGPGGTQQFSNIVYSYSAAQAQRDRFIREVFVGSLADFQTADLSEAERDQLNLRVAAAYHEQIRKRADELQIADISTEITAARHSPRQPIPIRFGCTRNDPLADRRRVAMLRKIVTETQRLIEQADKSGLENATKFLEQASSEAKRLLIEAGELPPEPMSRGKKLHLQ